VIAGPERRSRIITEEEKEIIAYHEGGHAVVQRVLPKCDPVTKVTIVSRGMALGYTMSLPQEDRYLHSKTEFEDKIAGMLGGNVAEQMVFGDTTTGSSNDIEKATSLARAMVTQYGMSEKLGPLTFGRKEEMIFLGREISEQRNYSDEVAAKIDAEVREIIDRAYDRAKEALVSQREVLDRLAALLVEKETIEHDEFESLFDGILPPRGERPAPRTAAEGEAPAGGDVEAEPTGDEPPTKRRRGPAPQPA
jgi:cell division protease FtsH